MQTQEPVLLADIDAELKRLWEMEQAQNKMRACLFTLVVYAKEQRHAAYLRHIVQSVIDKFPCRLIFIQLVTSENQNYLHTHVSTEAIGQGEAGIAYELINIDVASQQLHRVPFIVLPHLVPDLPLYLLWGEDPTRDQDILPHFKEFATRLIFDSDCVTDWPQFSHQMLSMIDSRTSGEILDLNWILTIGWRHILNQVFHSVEALNHLKLNKGIQIRYNGNGENWRQHCDTQAIYLAEWLATQLKWQFRKQERLETRTKYTFSNGSNDFEVTLIPESNPEILPGMILGFDVLSMDDHSYLIFPVQNQQKVVVHIASLETCDLPFTLPLPNLKRQFPYVQDLFYSSPSHHYRNMLQSISRNAK